MASCVGACVDGDNRKLPRDAAKSEQPEVYSIIIASDKTPDNAPADRLTEISTEREQVYLFIYWDSLTPGREYMTGWRLFDGADELLLGRTQLIRPASRQWMTWFVIPLSATTASGGRTTLGSWSLIVTADNETVAETQLSVVDVSSEQLQTSE